MNLQQIHSAREYLTQLFDIKPVHINVPINRSRPYDAKQLSSLIGITDESIRSGVRLGKFPKADLVLPNNLYHGNNERMAWSPKVVRKWAMEQNERNIAENKRRRDKFKMKCLGS